MVATMIAACALLGADAKLYELRVYHPTPGKRDALLARLREHAPKLYPKHGVESLGCWAMLDGKDERLACLRAYKDAAARTAAVAACQADAAWQAAFKDCEAGGALSAKVEVSLLLAEPFSPAILPTQTGGRVFEIRSYTATPGNLGVLVDRYRDNLMPLFVKHGIVNLAYWRYAEGQPKTGTTLVYMIAHKDRAAAKASFDALHADAAYGPAKKAAEAKAGGPLTPKGGVKNMFLTPTDDSPWK